MRTSTPSKKYFALIMWSYSLNDSDAYFKIAKQRTTQNYQWIKHPILKLYSFPDNAKIKLHDGYWD